MTITNNLSNVKCKFVDIFIIEESDGYISKSVAYYSNFAVALAELSKQNNPYRNLGKSLRGIQLENGDCFLLGQQIDIDQLQQHKQEQLAISAKNKLTSEELQALLNTKTLP